MAASADHTEFTGVEWRSAMLSQELLGLLQTRRSSTYYGLGDSEVLPGFIALVAMDNDINYKTMV